MLTLGPVVLVHARTGSYALAGAVTATAAVAFAAAAPVAGRLADRAGQARVLVVSLAVHLAGLAALVAAAVAGGPRWALLAAAVPAGAAVPQLPAVGRTPWAGPRAAAPARRPACALGWVLDGVVYMAGRVLVPTLAARLFPAGGRGGAAVLVTAGTLWFAGLRRTEPAPSPPGRRGGPRAIATPGLRGLGGGVALTGGVFGGPGGAMGALARGPGARAPARPPLGR